MKHKEYKATENKVLFDLNTFAYFTAYSCKESRNYDFVELNENEAVYYSEKFKEELEKLESNNEVQEEISDKPVLLKGTKGFKATSVEEPTDPIQRLKNLLKEEMIFKGHDLNNLVKPIIHE